MGIAEDIAFDIQQTITSMDDHREVQTEIVKIVNKYHPTVEEVARDLARSHHLSWYWNHNIFPRFYWSSQRRRHSEFVRKEQLVNNIIAALNESGL